MFLLYLHNYCRHTRYTTDYIYECPLVVDIYRDSVRPKGLGDELGRHFLKREGALIDHSLCLYIIIAFRVYIRRDRDGRKFSVRY